LVGRLERRERPQATQGIPHTEGRSRVREAAGPEKITLKKTPAYAPLSEVLASYAEEQPLYSEQRLAALQLAEACGKIQIEHLTSAIPNALCERWRKKWKHNTAINKRNALRRVLRFLEKICPSLPDLAKQLPHFTAQQPRTRIATAEEVDQLIRHAKPALKIILLLATDCGLRYTEARTLGETNLNREAKTITFRQKGGSTRTLPITDRILALINQAPEIGTPRASFVDRFHGREVQHSLPERWFHQLKQQLDIGGDLRIHDLRRTLATRAYDTTKDLRIVQQLLGHAHMSSTLHYLAPHDPANLRPLIEELQAGTKWKH
jgi:integrase